MSDLKRIEGMKSISYDLDYAQRWWGHFPSKNPLFHLERESYFNTLGICLISSKLSESMLILEMQNGEDKHYYEIQVISYSIEHQSEEKVYSYEIEGRVSEHQYEKVNITKTLSPFFGKASLWFKNNYERLTDEEINRIMEDQKEEKFQLMM